MRKQLKRVAAVLILAAGFVVSASRDAQATTVTVATFADPGNLFFTYSTNGTLAGTSLSSSGYVSTVGQPFQILAPAFAAGTFVGATYTFTTLSGATAYASAGLTSFTTFGGGSISFFSSTNVPLFNISFTGATLTDGGLGASSLSLQGVVLSLPSGPNPYSNPQQFSFSFANATGNISTAYCSGLTITGNCPGAPHAVNTIHWSSSFTSSANVTVIPEPGTMVLLGTGLFGLSAIVRRRRVVRK